MKIKKLTFKAALGLAALALFVLPNANFANAQELVWMDNTQIGTGANLNSETLTPDINAIGSTPGKSYHVRLKDGDFAGVTTLEIGDMVLKSGDSPVGSPNGGGLTFSLTTSTTDYIPTFSANVNTLTLTGGTNNNVTIANNGFIHSYFKDLTVANGITINTNDGIHNSLANPGIKLDVNKLTVKNGGVTVTGGSKDETMIIINGGADITGDLNLSSVDASGSASSVMFYLESTSATNNVLNVDGDIILTGSQNAGSIVIDSTTSNITLKSTGRLILNGKGGTTSLAVGLTKATEHLDVGKDVELLAGSGNATILGTTGSNFKANIGGNLKITTSNSGHAVFSYATANGTDNIVNVVGNVYIENGSIIGNGLASFQHGNSVNIGGDVTIKSLDNATSNSALAASFVAHGTSEDNKFGGNITLENASTDATNANDTRVLLSTTGKNIITTNLSLASTGSVTNKTYFDAFTGTTQINGGALTITGFNGALVTNTAANFLTLDFSNSAGANVNVKDGTLTLTNLTVAGGKANTFNFSDIDNELAFNNGILTVGNETVTGTGGTLNIKTASTTAAPLAFSNAAFYLSGLNAGDVSLTVTSLANGVTTPIVDVTAVDASNVLLALTGNNLKKGETLTLITGDILGNAASTPTAISATNIINNLNPGVYNISDYTVHWDANNSLILSLNALATTNPDGSIGSNTNNIWLEDLENIATPGTDGTSYLTADDIANLDSANNVVDAYDNLSPNAKELYKDLAFRTEETGYDDYKWVDTPEATDSRLALDDYFGVVVPKLVVDYNATHGGIPKTKDDYIIAFMNDLDPFIHAVGGLHISRVVVDSLDIILDNANTTNSSLAYAQSVAAGENTDYWRIWAKTSATWDKLANQGFYAGYTGSHFAGYLGGDRNFGNARIGVAIGTGKSKLEWDNNAKTDADNIIAKLYGEYDYNNFTFGASIGGGETSVETERYVAGTKRKADYDVSMFAFDVYTKYNHKTDNFEFTPEIGLSYLKTKQDSFTERGAAGMYFDNLNNDSALAYLKVSANVPVELENGIILKPKASAGISHELADNNSTLRSSFIGQPGQYVNNKGSELKRTSLDVGVGLEANFTNDLSAYIQYDAQIQSDYKRQTASAGLEFRF